MDLYLVRHAIAAERDATRWPDDSLRPLTKEGIERFRSAARGLARVVPSIERVLSSPYTRAWQTAEILHGVAGWPEPEPRVELEAVQSAAGALPVVERADVASLALVGHEPFLSVLGGLLLTRGAASIDLELKKGGVVFLDVASDGGTAALRWAMSPKLLRALAND